MSTVENAGKVWDLGLQPWPVQHDGSKAPRATGWSRDELPERLDRETTLEMFRHSDTGMGIITGVGGVELFEFEGRFVADGGWDEFVEACNDRGLGEVLDVIREGYEVASPSGGVHLMFRTEGPAEPNMVLASRDVGGTLLPLIGTRGNRGFAILAGSNGKIHPHGGSWRMLRGKPSKMVTIETWERDELYKLAREFDEAPEKASYQPQLRSDGPGIGLEGSSDYSELNDAVRPTELLLEAGWTFVKAKRTGSELWRRPGKNWGNSGELWPDGHFSVYTSTLEPSWREALGGKEQLSPVGLLAAVRHGGDFRAAASATRRSISPNPTPDVADSGGGDGAAGLNLPEEFWAAQPFLEAVRDAADAGLASRDAVLGSALARVSAMTPPAVKLPPIVGGQATLDYISCVVAASSGGKTISNGVAARMMPIRNDHVVLSDQSPGSGEGLIQAFLDQEVNEKGKKAGPFSYKFSEVRAIHLTADEGTGLHEQAGRAGTTIMQTLCSAWSGAQMGQWNASTETKRIVPAGKRRVAATINIQTKSANRLLDWSAIGLPQRVLFCWAHGDLPAEDREFPGEFIPTPMPMQDVPTELVVAEAIRATLRAERRAVARGEVVLDELDGHRRLLQLKTAALLAIADGRREVTEVDWDLAEQIVATSCRVRAHIIGVAAAEARTAAEAAGRRQGLIQVAASETIEVAERQKIAALAKRLVGVVKEQSTMGRNQLRKATTNTGTKHRFEPALDMAIDAGCLELEQGDEHGDTGSRVAFLTGWSG